MFLARLDSVGNLRWARQVGGSGATAHGASITVDNRGGLYVVGSCTGTLTVNTGPTSVVASPIFAAVLVLRCRATNGTTVWSRSVGSSGDYSTGETIAMRPGGSVFYIGGRLGGGTMSFAPLSVLAERRSGYVAAYTTAGAALWVRLCDNDGGLWGSSVQELAVDGSGCYATGFFSTAMELGGLSLPNSATISQTFVARLDPGSGAAVWLKASKAAVVGSLFSHVSRGSGLAVRGGACYVGGTFKGMELFGSYGLTAGPNLTGYLARYNAATGDVLWIKPLGFTSLAFGYTNTFVKVAANGARVVAAWGAEAPVRYSLLASHAPNGTYQWSVTSGGAGNSGASDVALRPDDAAAYWTGNFQLGSTFGPFVLVGPSSPASGFWVSVKPVVSGKLLPGMPAERISLYPNPAVDELRIGGLEQVTGPLKLTVYTALGKPVLTRMLDTAGLTLEVRDWQRGTYWVTLEGEFIHERHLVQVR
ncbi:SBBP repeat-containing protein [Hymenobacter daecheongensis]|uniref:SBBP repeat-containing protein n=1 Tax=Hymenobacter daecheongensis TaxID=496053 RepID=UPI00093324D7|nr:SBBP repeat-containing protein [Hymenobacter daecheongensis]